MKKKIKRFRWFITSKIDFESPIFSLFDSHFRPFSKSNEKNQCFFCDQRNLGCSTFVLVFGCELMNHVSHLTQAETKITFYSQNGQV